MNWYTLQVRHGDKLTEAFINSPSMLQAICETRDTYRMQGVPVSITARKALLKEWNHGNRTIKGELIE